MNLTVIPEVRNSQMLTGQAVNLISEPKIFLKQSLAQIADTEISRCNISFSDFAEVFSFEIVDIVGNEFSEQIFFNLECEDRFFVHLKLNGFWELENEPKFQLTDVDWSFEEKENNPTSAFVLNTFIASLCLSNKIKVEIPSVDYWFEVSVPSPLNKISEILQNRQLAYRLMVIEKSFQTSLPFPRRFIAGEEVKNIDFCYNAIVNKQFEWSYDSFTLFPFAIEENLKYLPAENTSYHLVFPFFDEIIVIFNRQLFLGDFTIEVEEAVIENYEEVKANFAELNGQTVKMIIKPLNGKVKYTFLSVPALPKKAWKAEVQNLVDLDEKLNSVFLDRYFKLAASTLEGLSEEQKESITERPKLNIKGFE